MKNNKKRKISSSSLATTNSCVYVINVEGDFECVGRSFESFIGHEKCLKQALDAKKFEFDLGDNNENVFNIKIKKMEFSSKEDAIKALILVKDAIYDSDGNVEHGNKAVFIVHEDEIANEL